MLERPLNSVDPSHALQPVGAPSTAQDMGRAEGETLNEPTARAATDVPPMTNTELVQLHVRVIALENLVIALLAEASDRQLQLAREMASYISPRPGYTRHPLTVDGAHLMLSLVDRARHFQGISPA